MPPPLDAVTVISLAEQYPGPYATLILADLGARVVLVERPTGDPSRANPAFFGALNRNKLSVTLDLRSDAGRDAFLALVREADALVEGFRPGAMARLGLAYDFLSELNPRLVYVSISGYGQTGPYASRPGHDLSFQALAGLLHDRIVAEMPATPWLSLANLSAGVFGAIGVLAGFVSRARTGRGSYVDVAMLDSLVSLLTVHLVPLLNGSGETAVPAEPGYGLFRTADDQLVALSIYGEDHFWAALCTSLGIADAGSLTAVERHRREPELRRAVAEAIRARKRDELLAELGRDDIPCAPVNDLADIALDEQVAARGLLVDVAGEDGASTRFVRQPVSFGGADTRPRRPVPRLGEHTEQLLREAGCSDEIIAAVLGGPTRKDDAT